MRILIVGGGGREHALAWAIGRSPSCSSLFIAPGNAGTVRHGVNVPVSADDIEGLLTLVEQEKIDLTVVGPEAPLVKGIVDRFEAAGRLIVGPSRAAAQLEGSKAFAKSFMERHSIPTASHRTFSRAEYAEALRFVSEADERLVVKASGLAAGKGAIVCEREAEAREAVTEILRNDAFGDAGEHVVIESYLTGEEASVFALCDGDDYVLLSPAQDHKRVGDDDTGPNTGGMGAYAPAPVVTDAVLADVRRRVIEPTLRGMRSEGYPYRGFLYVGLMIRDGASSVVEFNCRLGDPEAQVVLPLVDADVAELLYRQALRQLSGLTVPLAAGAAACVVLASAGYPDAYETGFEIEGLDEAAALESIHVFHAGTRAGANGKVVTSGGRVLGVTAVERDLARALKRAYDAVDRITFSGLHFRHDIGRRGLGRAPASAA